MTITLREYGLLLTVGLGLGGLAFAQTGPVLQGVLDTPPGATGTVSAYAVFLSGGNFKGLAGGPLGPGGEFSVALPDPVDPGRLDAVDAAGLCDDGGAGVSAIPNAVPHAMVMFVMWLGEETGSGAILASSQESFERLTDEDMPLQPGDFAVYQLYAATAFRMTGSCTVEDGIPVTFDIDAPAGWSLVTYGHGGGSDFSIRVASVPAVPQEARWWTFNE